MVIFRKAGKKSVCFCLTNPFPLCHGAAPHPAVGPGELPIPRAQARAPSLWGQHRDAAAPHGAPAGAVCCPSLPENCSTALHCCKAEGKKKPNLQPPLPLQDVFLEHQHFPLRATGSGLHCSQPALQRMHAVTAACAAPMRTHQSGTAALCRNKNAAPSQRSLAGCPRLHQGCWLNTQCCCSHQTKCSDGAAACKDQPTPTHRQELQPRGRGILLHWRGPHILQRPHGSVPNNS